MKIKLNLHSQVITTVLSASIYRIGRNAASGFAVCYRGNTRACFRVFNRLPEAREFIEGLVLRAQRHQAASHGSAGALPPPCVTLELNTFTLL